MNSQSTKQSPPTLIIFHSRLMAISGFHALLQQHTALTAAQPIKVKVSVVEQSKETSFVLSCALNIVPWPAGASTQIRISTPKHLKLRVQTLVCQRIHKVGSKFSLRQDDIAHCAKGSQFHEKIIYSYNFFW